MSSFSAFSDGVFQLLSGEQSAGKIVFWRVLPPRPFPETRFLTSQKMETGSSLVRVLSRIFCLGGRGVDPKKILEPRSGEEKFFRSSRGGGPEACSSEKF